MASVLTFQVLVKPVWVEFEEKRSRFVAYLEPVEGRQQALEFLESLRLLYPDARHHCWTYVVGDPACAEELAFSDDGEPGGTAGKPMLNVLQHRALGNCMAVVVRYFGGIKLGAGGLVRAYSNAVSLAVDAAELQSFVPIASLRLGCDFDQESLLRRMLESLSGEVLAVDYAVGVVLQVALPAANIRALELKLSEQGRGRMLLLEGS